MGSDKKAEALVAAATTLFSRYGLKRTSVDDIARHAGIAKGTVYLYFANKGALFGAVCDAVCERILGEATAAAGTDGPLVERLFRVLEAKYATTLALVDSSPHAAELMDSSNAYGADALARAETGLASIVRNLLKEGAEAGDIDLAAAGLSAADAANLVIRAAVGAASKIPDGTPPSAAEHRRRLRRLTEVLVRGLGGRPGAPAAGPAKKRK